MIFLDIMSCMYTLIYLYENLLIMNIESYIFCILLFVYKDTALIIYYIIILLSYYSRNVPINYSNPYLLSSNSTLYDI